MIADAIKDVSQRGAIVLDLFGGERVNLDCRAQSRTSRHISARSIPSIAIVFLARWEAFANDEAQLLHRVDDAGTRGRPR